MDTPTFVTQKSIFAQKHYGISWKQLLKLINEDDYCSGELSHTGCIQGRNSARILTPLQMQIIKKYLG